MVSHKIAPVPLEDMIWKADPNEFDFETTAEVELPKDPLDVVKGQPYAKKLLMRAIESHEHAIMFGPPGCGKSILATAMAEKYSKEIVGKQLFDQVAVHNFGKPNSPKILSFPTPNGSNFVKDLEYFIRNFADAAEKDWSIKNEISNTRISYSLKVNDEDMKKISQGKKELPVKTEATLGDLMRMATKDTRFSEVEDSEREFNASPEELFSVPILWRNQKERGAFFNMLSGGKLDDYIPTKHSLEERFPWYDLELLPEEDGKSKYASRMSKETNGILTKYGEHSKAGKFIREVRKRILKNPEIFRDGTLQASTPERNQDRKSRTEKEQEKFLANLLVDNSETKGLPVIKDPHPTLQSLLGEAGHDALNSTSQQERLIAGNLHLANGGFLITDELKNLLSKEETRDQLLTVLNDGEGVISGGHGYSSGTSAGIRSEPIPAGGVLMGGANEDILKIFKEYPKIADRFPVKITMDSDMDNTEENRKGYAEFVRYTIDAHNNDPETLVEIPHFSPEAVAAIIEKGVRLSDKGKGKLTNIFRPLKKLVKDSAFVALEQGHNIVGREHVLESLEEIRNSNSSLENRILEKFENGSTNLQVEGYKVGEVNGLVILKDPLGSSMIGFPQKIETSLTRSEKFRVKSIDQTSGLSGKTMKKANQVSESFLKQRFVNQKINGFGLDFNFSQAYSGIDGDSASISTTLALLSRFSEIPANQSYAVTGSMDFKGVAQVIGGVNEKIEGFYRVCKQKGFKDNSEYGVVIPRSNVRDLMLPEEIAKNEQFKIYPVSHLEEAVEIVLDRNMADIENGIKKTIENYSVKK